MRRWINMALVVLGLSGCSLLFPGDFTKDHEASVNVHMIEKEKWLKKKGITEKEMIGKTRQEIRRILGKPNRIFTYRDAWDCPQQIRENRVTNPTCLQEEWVYMNWYGIPYLSGFSSYSFTIENDRLLQWTHFPWEGETQ